MTDTEPEPEMPKAQPRPFQFSIAGLMILTAVVAGLFALGTQVGFIYAVGLLHFILLILALIYRTCWKGIMAINFSVFNCYFLPLILAFVFPDKSFVIIIWLIFFVASIGCGIFIRSSGSRLDRISVSISLWVYLLFIGVIMWFLRTRFL